MSDFRKCKECGDTVPTFRMQHHRCGIASQPDTPSKPSEGPRALYTDKLSAQPNHSRSMKVVMIEDYDKLASELEQSKEDLMFMTMNRNHYESLFKDADGNREDLEKLWNEAQDKIKQLEAENKNIANQVIEGAKKGTQDLVEKIKHQELIISTLEQELAEALKTIKGMSVASGNLLEAKDSHIAQLEGALEKISNLREYLTAKPHKALDAVDIADKALGKGV